MADTDVVIKIGLEVESMKAQLAKLEKDVKDSGQNAADAFGKSLKSGLLKVGALLGGFQLFKSAIKESAEAEVNLNRLNQALRNSGQSVSTVGANFDSFAEEIQKTTTTTKDTAVELLTLATNMGFTGQRAKDLTTAAMNLSAATGTDLTTALKQLGGTATGEAGRLGKLVPGLNDLSKSALQAGGAIDLVNKRFQDAARNETRTFSGALTQAGNAFNEILQAAGGLVTKSPAVIGLLNGLSKVFFQVADAISKVSNDGLKEFIVLGIRAAQVIGVLGGAIIDIGVGAFKALGAAIGGVAAALVNLSTGNFSGAKEAITASFEDIKNSVTQAFSFDAATAAAGFGEQLIQFTEQAKPVAEEQGRGLAGAFSMGVAKGISWDDFTKAFNDASNKIAISAASLAKSLNTFFIQGMVNSFSALGAALVKGENAFEAFGKAVLGALGDILIFFGQQLIAIGVGLSTVPFLFGLSGPAAIAAGISAVVLGGALKALAGGGSGGATQTQTSPQGGGSAFSPELGNVASEAPAQIERSPTTAVTVNVQGNILDRRESGLAIAEIINETFGSNGVVLAQAT